MGDTLTKRAFAVFEDALDVEDAGRDAFLAQACDGDAELLAEVQRLIRADVAAERAMPTGGLQPGASPMPERIGRYRIVDRIGVGGMGEVFVGARDDGLFDHAVAIKRVRPSLLPETARALFDRERRALATLHHRHIAQLFDGGVDETGAPYLIMELVRGAPIDQYAAARDFTPRQIVEKLIQVAEAVQHAHQNLIVHADLKPANILVNEVGDPKVVDFGVARMLRDADDTTLHPQTPGYASPQREAGASPTPADDVFALGAILRALLTGEAPRGSTHTVVTSEAIMTSTAFAGHDDAWRANRSRAVQGDLDAIIEKACAPVAENRYQAAVALAADLRAWLDIRPLADRADDRLYVFRQFIRRRRWRVILSAAAAFGLVVALMLTSTLYSQADHARREAEARFTDVRALAKYLLYDVYDRLERTPLTLGMRRDVARVAQGYLSQLADTPTAPADVLREAADGLVRIADLQGGRSRANLGEPLPARENLRRAREIVERLLRRDPSDQDYLELSTRIDIHEAAIDMNSQQELEAAGKLLDQAKATLARLPADPRAVKLLSIEYEVETAVLGNWKGTYADSAVHARKAVAAGEALPPDSKDIRESQYLLARAYDALAESIYYGVSAQAAEPLYRKLVETAGKYFSVHPEDMGARRIAIEARWALGTTLLSLNRAPEGLVELNEAATMVPALLQYQPDDQGAARTERIVLAARAQALSMSGKFDEGVNLLREEAAEREKRYRSNDLETESIRSYGIILSMLADLYADHKDAGQACPLYSQAEAVFIDLDRRGMLSQLDRDSSLKMIQDREIQTCKT